MHIYSNSTWHMLHFTRIAC